MQRTGTALRITGRYLWWSIAPLAGVVGVACGYIALGTANAVLFAGLTASFAMFTGWMLRSQATRPRPVPPLAFIGLLAGAAGLAVVGVTIETGSAGLVTISAVGATGWFVVRRPRDNDEVAAGGRQVVEEMRPVGSPVEQLPPDPLPSLTSLHALGTAELCRTWQLTYLRLRRATSPAEVQHLTELRRGCLAQLERRDPVVFGRWLPTARAASDPARHFCHPLPRAAGDVAP